jgi:hypothetical protein
MRNDEKRNIYFRKNRRAMEEARERGRKRERAINR